MMGQLTSGQARLFYSFNREDRIPANRLLRGIDRYLDLSDLRHYLTDFSSSIRCPSIDPELMFRMLTQGERGLCIELNERGADIGIGAERAQVGSDRVFTGSAFGRQDCCDFHDACL